MYGSLGFVHRSLLNETTVKVAAVVGLCMNDSNSCQHRQVARHRLTLGDGVWTEPHAT